MIICLDVGAHEGQSLEEMVEHPELDAIYAFEPMKREFDTLVERFGDRENVYIYNYGLSDRTGTLPVYGSNDRCEASVYKSKTDLDPNIMTECEFRNATEVFLDIPPDARVLVRMNCEGSEVPILNNLISSGQIAKIHSLMFELDIRRCAGHEHEGDELLARLAAIGFDRFECHEPLLGEPTGTHRERIAAWLDKALA